MTLGDFRDKDFGVFLGMLISQDGVFLKCRDGIKDCRET